MTARRHQPPAAVPLGCREIAGVGQGRAVRPAAPGVTARQGGRGSQCFGLSGAAGGELRLRMQLAGPLGARELAEAVHDADVEVPRRNRRQQAQAAQAQGARRGGLVQEDLERDDVARVYHAAAAYSRHPGAARSGRSAVHAHRRLRVRDAQIHKERAGLAWPQAGGGCAAVVNAVRFGVVVNADAEVHYVRAGVGGVKGKGRVAAPVPRLARAR